MTVFFFKRQLGISSAMMVVFLVFGASAVLATTSRINSLGGGNGDYFEDDANVMRWYGSLTDYPDQVVLQSGNFNIPDGYWKTSWLKGGMPGVGVHLGLGETNRLGTAAVYIQHSADDRMLSLFNNDLQGSLSMMYSLDFGPLTGSLLYRFNGWKADHDHSIQYRVHTLGAGVRMDLGSTAYLDLAGELRSTHLEGTSPPSDFSPDSNNNFGLRGRAFIALGPRTALVPLVDFTHDDRNDTYNLGSPNEAFRQKGHLVCLGLGLNHYPDTDHLLLLNAEYLDGMRKETSSYSLLEWEQNWTALTLRAGFESRIASWLTTRGSMAFVDYSIDDDWQSQFDPYFLETEEDPILRLNLGAAFHLGPADLDLAFGERYPEVRYLGQIDLPRKHWLSATARLLF